MSSLWAYAWCPVSHTIRSRGESITRCSASVISTAPSELARCPPVAWTVRIIFSRSSAASGLELLAGPCRRGAADRSRIESSSGQGMCLQWRRSIEYRPIRGVRAHPSGFSKHATRLDQHVAVTLVEPMRPLALDSASYDLTVVAPRSRAHRFRRREQRGPDPSERCASSTTSPRMQREALASSGRRGPRGPSRWPCPRRRSPRGPRRRRSSGARRAARACSARRPGSPAGWSAAAMAAASSAAAIGRECRSLRRPAARRPVAPRRPSSVIVSSASRSRVSQAAWRRSPCL